MTKRRKTREAPTQEEINNINAKLYMAVRSLAGSHDHEAGAQLMSQLTRDQLTLFLWMALGGFKA